MKLHSEGNIERYLTVGLLSHYHNLIQLCHCALEACDDIIDKQIAFFLEEASYFSIFPQSPHDCAAICHVLTNAPECTDIHLRLSGCHLSDNHIAVFANILASRLSLIHI